MFRCQLPMSDSYLTLTECYVVSRCSSFFCTSSREWMDGLMVLLYLSVVSSSSPPPPPPPPLTLCLPHLLSPSSYSSGYTCQCPLYLQLISFPSSRTCDGRCSHLGLLRCSRNLPPPPHILALSLSVVLFVCALFVRCCRLRLWLHALFAPPPFYLSLLCLWCLFFTFSRSIAMMTEESSVFSQRICT